MTCIQFRRLTAIVLAVVCAASTTVVAAPYDWTIGQVKSLADVTAGFHGGAGQLSTINSITPVTNGIQLDVTYRIGQEGDPFGADYGLGFARVSLQGGLGTGLDLSAFTSSKAKVTTNTGITVQSFIQTDFTEGGSVDDGDANPGETFSFLFWEHNDDVAAGTTDADLDFSSAAEFDGDGTDANVWNGANPKPIQGTGVVRSWGFQLAKFSGMVIGQPVQATITIEGIPEPSCIALVGLAALGMVGFARRRG